MSSSPFTQSAAAPTSSWWSRNWKWSLPVGVLAGAGLLGGVILAFVAGIFGLLKSSDAYQGALAQATASPAVQEALGTPITASFFVMGEVHLQNSTGRAKLTIPISGPKGDGTIHVRATKADGRWTYSLLTVEIAGSDQRIDLLVAANAVEREEPQGTR